MSVIRLAVRWATWRAVTYTVHRLPNVSQWRQLWATHGQVMGNARRRVPCRQKRRHQVVALATDCTSVSAGPGRPKR